MKDFIMSHKIKYAVALALLLALVMPLSVLAHGHTEVGDYELVIGFHNEPAYQGEPNGLDLFVTNMKTKERVNGLEETLKAEIIYGASKQELTMEAQWGQDGAYTAYVLPTEAGDYTWHIWGDIEGTPVDVSMTSSPDTFSSVEPKSAVAFPAAEPTPKELREQSQLALTVGIVGALLGAIGIILGFLGMRARRS
jgi:hypothetical protein